MRDGTGEARERQGLGGGRSDLALGCRMEQGVNPSLMDPVRLGNTHLFFLGGTDPVALQRCLMSAFYSIFAQPQL